MSIRVGFDVGSDTIKTAIIKDGGLIEVLEIVSVQGQPMQKTVEILRKLAKSLGSNEIICGATGSGSGNLSNLIGAEKVHEPNALAAAIDKLHPEVRTVIEMGRESQKYILFERDSFSGRLLVEDSNLGNKCASGSGSFLDHMAKRLNYSSINEFAKTSYHTPSPATLSGRCAVFTESDIVHLYQKGTPKDRIAAGIHQAIARNYRSAIARGKEFIDKIAFIGGVSENPAAIKYLSEELGLSNRIFIPEHNRSLGAIGAALRASNAVLLDEAIAILDAHISKPLEYPGCTPISMSLSEVLPEVKSEEIPKKLERAALGVDIGSVSTKAALVTEVNGKLHVIASHYRRTDGNPLEAVKDTLSIIHNQIVEKGYEIEKISAATTGSGRYLTGDYIGADFIRNEITAQASGARAYSNEVDTIFEIGGQDSKYIRLDDEVIIDFEMNKACAAGTGAFLEKQASRLDIALEDFGDTALCNTRPPELDWTCTVFSESAMVYYQQNNVPIPDLAAGICLASVKNYLNKNVASRSIGKVVAFQGAVAFNKGMIAAFETILGIKIVVPPYPHITGAVGAARIAYLANPEKSLFRGFENIAATKYEIKSFECKSCANRCDVNTFQMEDGPKYFYNDRCEKFSAVQKKRLGDHLPDLFAEYEDLIMNTYSKAPKEDALKIGIPRGLMFSEYFPFYKAFFTELGFDVIISDQTNKRIVEMGLDAAIGEPCFPFKVAHGHHIDLVTKKVDAIFSPRVINAAQPNSNLNQAQTCPYLQAAPDVISSAIGIKEQGIKFISPSLHFKRGKKHLEMQFIEVGKRLNKSAKQSKAAFAAASQAYLNFKNAVQKRGAEILNDLKPNQMAFVVVGRPYTLYDPVVNMDIGKKIQDLGILAIPQDFLPLEAADISDTWPNAFSRQIQRKLMAARLIRQDVRLKAVVLTYFACGPDSFGNPFFKDEINEPCYVMQIDEHTADAGVITRIEAFSDTANKSSAKITDEIRSIDSPITKLNGKKLWIPYANESARVLAACMRAYGVVAEALPLSPDEGMNLARKAISEDVCLPALNTTEDILYRANQHDFDPKKEAFFQGNAEGPCRYGMYSMLQRRILDKAGFRDADVVTLGSKSEHGGLGILFAYVAWQGFVSHDLLLKMVQRVRPYEKNKGDAERVFEKYIQEIIKIIPKHKDKTESHKLSVFLGDGCTSELENLLFKAQKEFQSIPQRDDDLPLVGVVGEFYVRLHPRANQDILKKLEAEGAETWLAPMSEFLSYANNIGTLLSKERFKEDLSRESLQGYLAGLVNGKLIHKSEHRLFNACLPLLDGYEDISSDSVIKEGSKYIDFHFGGEAICSMGKAEDFAKRGLSGIVSVIPFNCMPGNVVTALSVQLRRQHDNIPFLNLDYDGFPDSSRDSKIINFMWQVKERFEGAKSARKEAEAEIKEAAFRSG